MLMLVSSFRMGSFTSMSKIIPATDTDKDIENEFALIKNQQIAEEDTVNEDRALSNFLNYCSRKLSGLPAPYSRKWKNSTIQRTLEGKMQNDVKGQIDIKEENIRVLQWNVLSQSKYKNYISLYYSMKLRFNVSITNLSK